VSGVRDLLEAGQATQFIVWGPAEGSINQITEYLSGRGCILAFKPFILKCDISKFVKAVYHHDSTPKWKIQKKIFHLESFQPTITYIAWIPNQPRWDLDLLTGNVKLVNAQSARQSLRRLIASSIPNYFFDIAIHGGDSILDNKSIFHAIDLYGAEIDS
jgi:hypothetical protein